MEKHDTIYQNDWQNKPEEVRLKNHRYKNLLIHYIIAERLSRRKKFN